MTKELIALSLGFAGLLFLTHPAQAQAQAQCGPRAAVVKTLAEKYAETRRSIGISANNMVMEVYAADAGTWTITVTTPQGMTCLVASGQGFEAVVEELPAKGEPA
ncbi:MAG: hypothetical protein ACT4OK_06480 [Gemmobacter sp.]